MEAPSNAPFEDASDPPMALAASMEEDPPLDGSPVSERALRALTDRLSRQLRGLVNSIEGYTDLLGARLSTPEQRELSQRIFEGTARIEQVVRRLRYFSTPIQPVFQEVSLRDLIDGVHHAIGSASWHRVVVDGLSDVTDDESLLADPVLLRQAVQALVQNALDATAHDVRITIAPVPDAHQVRFAVWNEGAMSLPHPHDVVFTPFFSTKDARLGMGLPLARRIAEAHGGRVTLEQSTEAAGTRFALTVPHPRDDVPEALVLPPR